MHSSKTLLYIRIYYTIHTLILYTHMLQIFYTILYYTYHDKPSMFIRLQCELGDLRGADTSSCYMYIACIYSVYRFIRVRISYHVCDY